VELEPGNTDYRRSLLRALYGRRDHAEGEKAARDLLVISPENGTAHALLALILLEKASSNNDFQEADAQSESCRGRRFCIAAVHYGQGVLALRRNQAPEAVRLLRLASAEDPSAETTYYQLAQAERLAGNATEAGKAAGEYAARTDRKRREIELLRSIGRKPEDRRLYEAAIAFTLKTG